MPFDAAAFERAEFKPRTAVVEVEALAVFFPDGEPARWTVRGLSASELHRAMEAGKRQGSVEAIVRAIATGGDQAQAVRKALGLTNEITELTGKGAELGKPEAASQPITA